MNFSFMRLNRYSSTLSLCLVAFVGFEYTTFGSDSGYAPTLEKASQSDAYNVDQMYDYAFGALPLDSNVVESNNDSSAVKAGPTAREIWSEFLFGSQRSQTSKPQFVLNQHSEAPVPQGPRGTNSQSVSTIRRFFGLPVTPEVGQNDQLPQTQNVVQRKNQPQKAASDVRSLQQDVVRESHQISRKTVQEVQTFPNMASKQAENAQEQVTDSLHELNQAARRNVVVLQKSSQKAQRQFENNLAQSQDALNRRFDPQQTNIRQAAGELAAQSTETTEKVNETIDRSRESIANARRQRLNELNQLLASKRPEEFAERMRQSQPLDFDVAEANRPMIRQASAVEPQPVRQNAPRNKVANIRSKNTDVAPVRPQSLKQSSSSRVAVASPLKDETQTKTSANVQSSRVVHANAAAPSKETNSLNKKIRSVRGTVYKVAGPQLPSANTQKTTVTQEPPFQRLPSIQSHQASTAKATFTEPLFDHESQEEEEELEQTTDGAENEEINEPQTGVIRSKASFIDPKDL